MKLNLIENIIVGEYGAPVFLQLVDGKSDPIDISSYTTREVLLRSPDSLKTITYTAPLFFTGEDGKIYFTPASGDIDREGEWTGMIRLTATGIVTKSEHIRMIVQNTL